MWNLMIGILRHGNIDRKRLKAIILWSILHLVTIVVAMAGISCHYRTILNPISAWTGTGLIGVFILFAWTRGGVTLDLILGTYIATDNELARVISRVIFGFITVESFIVTCGCILPMYSNPGALAFLLISSASYFLYRIMGGLTINWKAWANFPLVMMLVAVFVLLRDAYFPSLSVSSMGFKQLMLWGMGLGLAMVLLNALIGGKENPAPASDSRHGGHSNE